MKELMANASKSIDNVVKQLEDKNNTIAFATLGIIILLILKMVIDNGYSFTVSFSKDKKVEISLHPKDKSDN